MRPAATDGRDATPEELAERLDRLAAGLASPDEATRRDASDALVAIEDPRAAGFFRTLARARDPLPRAVGRRALERLEARRGVAERAGADARRTAERRDLVRTAAAFLARHRRRIALLLLLFVVALLAARFAAARREAYERAPLDAAETLLRSGRHAEAATALRAFLAERPRDARALARLADLAFATGDHDEARRTLERLEAAAPGSFEYRRMAGKGMLAAAPGKAVAFYDALLAERPEDETCRLERAFALDRDGRDGEARAALESLLAGAPDLLAARLLHAELLHRSGAPEAAEGALVRAFETNRADARAHGRLGLLRFDRGNFAAAAEAFAASRLLSPRDAALAFNHGLALDRAGRTGEAEEAYADALRLDPDHRDARLNLAVLQGRAGRPAAESDGYRLLAERHPAFAPAWFNAGAVFLESGRPDRAERLFERAAKVAPAMAPALLNAGLLAERRARGSADPTEAGRAFAVAAERYRAALAVTPDDATARARLAALPPAATGPGDDR